MSVRWLLAAAPACDPVLHMTKPSNSSLAQDRRGATSIMVAAMAPVLLGLAAMVVDTGMWVAGQTQLQVQADAAAMGSAFMLTQPGFLSLDSSSKAAALQAVAAAEAQGVSARLAPNASTPAVTWSSTSVTVTLTSQTSSYFLGVFNIAAPRVRAVAKAGFQPSTPCVLALATSGVALLLDNVGTVTATQCPVTVNAGLTVNSGTVSGSAVNVKGAVTMTGGGNSISPAPSSMSSAAADPFAGQQAPGRGTCVSHPDYTQYGTYTASPGTWCSNTTVGGNGSTITFSPGVYYVVGNLIFNNASITSANGVTFVVTGNLSWTNYSNTPSQITAPSSGATAGIAFWQPCASGQTSSFQGGSTLQVSGAIYAPCSSADIGNNAQIVAPSGGSMSFISNTLYVHGSGALRAANRSSSSGTTPVLML